MLACTTFEETVIARADERPVVVAFVSSHAPLRAWLEAVLVRAIREHDDRIALVVIDVDRDPEVARRYHLAMVPTVKAFRHGELVGGFVSARPPEAVTAFLEKLLGPSDAERLREELRAEREWPDVVAALDECDYARAFELLLSRAQQSEPRERERIRRLMVSLFAKLGNGHPLSARYRRRLAATLY
jgi:thioredoxin-like negative regulator of GroEL